MPLLFLLLQVSRRSRLDSSFQSLEKITPNSLFSWENPVLVSLVAIVLILAVVFIFYRYVIIPMRKKHLEEKENLRLQQAELMALFAELSPDPIFRFDLNGKIILANNSAHKIFLKSSVLGEQVDILLPFFKEFEREEIIRQGKVVEYTTLVGDSYFQFVLSGVPKFGVCQVYGRDISELKAKERELKEALVRAEESKKLKEYFLAQISHEIRSPLNVIEGYSEFLMNELKDELQEEYSDIFRSMKINSKRLYRTFDLLLNTSQLHTGKYEARFEKVNIYALLKTLFSEFKTFADEKNIKFTLTNTLDEEPVAYLDYYSMVQIFVNLLDNAFKYTLEGKIDIRIYRDDVSICIDIHDTGIGISTEYQNKLFTPFSQERMGYTRPYEGTGLGLALVKSFIDVNKAKIRVKSEPQAGSTFTVILSGEKRWELQKRKNISYS